MKWWEQTKGQVHGAVIGVVKQIQERQQYRHQANLTHLKLYGNTDALGMNSFFYSQPNPINTMHRPVLNVVQSCVDTAAAKIAKNKPSPKILTDGANWKLGRKAENLTKFLNGSFYLAKTYESSVECFFDCAVFGTGIKKVYPDFEKKRVVSERVIPDEILIDDSESWHGDTRNIYQVKPVSRETLLNLYPEHAEAILALTPMYGASDYTTYGHFDSVPVFEGWHLGLDKAPGRHAIIIDGADLQDEDWEWDRFPFTKLPFNPRRIGWWGQGIPEQLIGLQTEINKLLRSIQIAHHLLSAPAVFVEANSNVLTSTMNNEIGRIVKYSGTMPEVKIFQTVAPEIYEHLERLYMRAFEIVGISQLSAQSKKPMGLDSGKALREYYDIETERFALLAIRWEQFHLDEAELHLLCAKELNKKIKDYSVPAQTKNSIEYINWKDVDMERDAFLMQAFPVSSLPREPAARLQYVNELAQAGYIDPDTTIQLMNFPDLEAYQSKRLAGRTLIEKIVNDILDGKKSLSPEPEMDLEYGTKFAQLSYNYALVNNAPDDVLENLRNFLSQIQFIKDKAVEAAIQQQAAQNQQLTPGPAAPNAALNGSDDGAIPAPAAPNSAIGA